MSFNVRFSLHLADTNLIMSQRLCEWTGHGPALEQDIAMTNIALDMLGQCRLLYQYAAVCINQDRSKAVFCPSRRYPLKEDDLAYHRLESHFINLLMAELPNGHWGQTILKIYLTATWMEQVYGQLSTNEDAELAAIAQKSLKEVQYHVKWSSDWVLRLGDGTPESHQKMKEALAYLWPYTHEFFVPTEWNEPFVTMEKLSAQWHNKVFEQLRTAKLQVPLETARQAGGIRGVHTENMGYILAEMQYLQRVHSDSEW